MVETITAPLAFDPEQFRRATRAQWETAAGAWHYWAPLLGRWLGPSTEAMLDMAAVGQGARVLDVAAGAGEPQGYVLATDLSPAILRFASDAAREAGFGNVETMELDGERHDTLPEGSFNAAISRLGLIYFPDQQRALGGEGVLAKSLEQAGFREVDVHSVDSPVRLPSAAECVRFERESFGALHQMMATPSESERAETWQEIEATLRKFETSGGFVGPCEMPVGAGTR